MTIIVTIGDQRKGSGEGAAVPLPASGTGSRWFVGVSAVELWTLIRKAVREVHETRAAVQTMIPRIVTGVSQTPQSCFLYRGIGDTGERFTRQDALATVARYLELLLDTFERQFNADRAGSPDEVASFSSPELAPVSTWNHSRCAQDRYSICCVRATLVPLAALACARRKAGSIRSSASARH